LQGLTREEKTALVRELAGDFIVLAEVGAKAEEVPVVAAQWLAEMEGDLDAGARWVIAEGRESGTVGLYHANGSVREDLVDILASRLGLEQVIFEAPRKSQQAWFINHLGSDVNLGNVAPEELLPLETLRLGLRADTAAVAARS
jgi:phosphosulfolactate synthase